MDPLNELYENGLYSPKLITEVTIPQWAKLLDYRTPITGLFAVIKKEMLVPIFDGYNVYKSLIAATSLTIISDSDEVNFFDRCYNDNMFAIIHTGQIKIHIITAIKVVLPNSSVAYKTRFNAHCDEDSNDTDFKIGGITLFVVSKPNSDPNSFPDTIHDIALVCEISGDPDLIDTISDRYSSTNTEPDNINTPKPSIFGFFGNFVKRKTETNKNNNSKQKEVTADKTDTYPDYDVL